MSTSVRGSGLRGLAVHFGVLILTISLLTSVVITWISVRGIERFLARGIEQQFPADLESARERIDVWYAQRELDVASFARSDILAEALRDSDREAGQSEADAYLSYVLGRFPQYAGLVVLDDEGKVWLQVGGAAQLPPGVRASIATQDQPSVSPLVSVDGESFQLVSSPLIGSEATLHGLLRMSALDAILMGDLAQDMATLTVVDAAGERVAGGPSLPRDALGAEGSSEVVVVESEGESILASARALERFGWTIVIQDSYEQAFAPVGDAVRRAWTGNLLVVAAAGLLAFALGAWRARPILALADGASRLAAGETDVAVPVTRAGDEVQVLARSFNEMAARLAENRLELEQRNHDLQVANEVLEQLSITDGLTKLHNHRYFQDQFERESRRADRTGESLALILVDLDDFKKLNDTLGHATGDAMLVAVAECMCDAVRSTDILTRYGGEEFAVLAPATHEEGALALAEKLRGAVAACSLEIAGESVSITASVGVALHAGDRPSTFDQADRALYAAKQGGKNCVRSATAQPA